MLAKYTVPRQKRRRKNLDEDDGDDTSSKLTRNTIDHDDDDQKPATASAPMLSECIQAAGITQSRLVDRWKKKAKVNDRIVAMHSKWVTAKQSMIQDQKFLISMTDHDDQKR